MVIQEESSATQIKIKLCVLKVKLLPSIIRVIYIMHIEFVVASHNTENHTKPYYVQNISYLRYTVKIVSGSVIVYYYFQTEVQYIPKMRTFLSISEKVHLPIFLGLLPISITAEVCEVILKKMVKTDIYAQQNKPNRASCAYFLDCTLLGPAVHKHHTPFTVSGTLDRALLTTIRVYGQPLTPYYRNQPGAITRANIWQAHKHFTVCQNRVVLSPWINDDIDVTTPARNNWACGNTTIYPLFTWMTII